MLCSAVGAISFASLLKCQLFLICYHHKVTTAVTNHGLIRSWQSFAQSPFTTECYQSFRLALDTIVHLCFSSHELSLMMEPNNLELQIVERDQAYLRWDKKKDQGNSNLCFSHFQHRNCILARLKVLLLYFLIQRLESPLQSSIPILRLFAPLTHEMYLHNEEICFRFLCFMQKMEQT